MARLSRVLVLVLPLFACGRVGAQELVVVGENAKVRVAAVGGLSKSTLAEAFVITHGMGGADERFTKLGVAIKTQRPEATVLVVDWTPGATNPKGGLTTPWAVSPNIDPTGAALASLLMDLHDAGAFDPARATFIGESFGNYVNNRAAAILFGKGLGKAAVALAFNPASELGGYEPPQLPRTFDKSASFHTPSLFDTQRKIAAFSLKLQTTSKSAFEQHTSGIPWLTRQVATGQMSWLGLEPVTADGMVTADGSFAPAVAMSKVGG